MTVLPFARFRFTRADIHLFEELADNRIKADIWVGHSRITHSDCDEIHIFLTGFSEPTFRLLRQSDGRYTFSVRPQSRDGWSLISNASSLRKCLDFYYDAWEESRAVS